MFFIRIFMTFIFLMLPSFAKQKVLKLAPLPMADAVKTTKIFLPFANYIKKSMGVQVELVNLTNYEDIITGLQKNDIDLAYLGPLPYAVLKSKSKNIIPIVGFFEKDGSRGYHCVLIASELDSIPFKNLRGGKVALTQPLSTCGYFLTSQLLKSLNNTNIEDMKYRYVKKHTKVATSILQGRYLLGGIKDSVASEFKGLGLRVLKTSKLLPSFTLVANANTMSKENISRLQNRLLDTPKSEYSKWGEKISFGMFKAHEKDFKHIQKALRGMNIPQKGNF